MPRAPVPDELSRLLARPNVAVVATVGPDGGPRTVPTWYLWEDGRVLLSMDDDRARLRDLRRDPRVSLTVFDGANLYTHVSLRGRVVAIHDDADRSDTARVWKHYGVQQPPARTDARRVSVRIEVERWHAWGSPEAAPARDG